MYRRHLEHLSVGAGAGAAPYASTALSSVILRVPSRDTQVSETGG